MAPRDPVRAVLQEFVEDVEAVGVQHIQENWPDLYVSYKKALVVLAEDR